MSDDVTSAKAVAGSKKPCIHFVPPVAILEEAVAMAEGAGKYALYDWQDKPIDANTYYSAAGRHLMQWFTGEDRDVKSGALHLAHARACLGILIDAAATGKLIDNRPVCASASEAIERLTKG